MKLRAGREIHELSLMTLTWIVHHCHLVVVSVSAADLDSFGVTRRGSAFAIELIINQSRGCLRSTADGLSALLNDFSQLRRVIKG